MEQWVEETLEKIRQKMEWVCTKNRDKIPYTTGENGTYDDKADATKEWRTDDGLNWWTNGFWPGLMWLLYQDTGAVKYKETARGCEKKLEQCLTDFYGMHHDVGFMFVLGAVTDYRLTGDAGSKRTALHAANLLAGRFNPAGRYIRAWNDLEEDTRGWAIIDCMMNLSLLYWAAEEQKDPRFQQIAMAHADTAMQHFIRPDGSVNHIVEFDPETGEFIRSHGGQGYSEGSSWSRGQGWAVYGFAVSYLHTGKQEYLDAAKRVAHYCLANLPENGILPLDFRQPEEPALEDSCGACVIASGLLTLAQCVQEREKKLYRNGAWRILNAIAEQRADYGEGCDAIVQNCSSAYHVRNHHITMNYADFYFIEALYKLKGTGILIW